MKKNILLILLSILAMRPLTAQSSLTLDRIWASGELYPQTVPGFNFLNDGRHFTRLENNQIRQYDLTTGQLVKTIFDGSGQQGLEGRLDGYEFSDDEEKILISTQTEAIYRRSSKALHYVYDRESGRLYPLFDEGKQQYATFNPQADKVAFVFENNLYYRDLTSGDVIPVTTDGVRNEIINGATDWVYEEELSFAKAFEWSPDGKRLAFYRFDERRVPEFTMTNYRGALYPEYVTFKYPKVGEENSIVRIHLYELAGKKTVAVETGSETDQYIPRIKWTQDPDQLCVFRMNRHQDKVELLLADVQSGQTRPLLTEQEERYVSRLLLDNLTFLKDGRHFIWTSERDGWHHIYLFDMQGRLVRQLTKGEWEVDAFYGVDEKNGLVYYQAAEVSPLERQVYAIGLDGEGKKALAGRPGWNDAQFSSTFDYFVLEHSTANSPVTFTVFDRQGNKLREIEDNDDIRRRQETLKCRPVEFIEVPTTGDVMLNGWLITPEGFDPDRGKYPVLMFVYGGPGSQQVTNAWLGQNYWWFQLLANQGYVVACVDNRGTGGRGEAFKKITYLQLGHYETIDQIEAAKYLAGLEYTDPDRIGIFGWSYGGYLSSLCIFKGNDVFKTAIAVAPVTNWKWYDTIYTERFMRTLEENREGYQDNSPVFFADRLKGSYLLVHGMGDDNVHFQNTAEMVNALVNANKQFETYFYPNRNHGIYGGYTRLHLYRKMTEFLSRNLRGGALVD